MSGARWPASLLLGLLGLLGLFGLLAGCDGEPVAGDSAESERPTPSLGASAPPESSPPQDAMDQLERSVADKLAPRLGADGLDLDYVECPGMPDGLPATLTCKGYVDGVVGDVEVELSKDARGRVAFDAWLGDGVLATRRLVSRLEDEGYTQVDCGDAPAYPAQPGMRILCRVHLDGETLHMEAEVTDDQGSVRIEKW